MRIMRFDEAKLQRILDAASEAHATLLHVGDELRNATVQRNRLRSKVDADLLEFGKTTHETSRLLTKTSDEVERLKERQAQLQQLWSSRRAVAAACEDWARTQEGQRAGHSVIGITGEARV